MWKKFHLVDEYDQPLVNHLGKGEGELEIAKQNREILREFFGVLKGGNVNKALQFVFLTGISKFTRVSIFSELNNLNVKDFPTDRNNPTDEKSLYLLGCFYRKCSLNHVVIPEECPCTFGHPSR
jgi:hypothetical protein